MATRGPRPWGGNSPWRQTEFNIDGIEIRYSGYTQDYHWNGWECPAFEREIAVKVLADCQCEVTFEDDHFIVFIDDGIDAPARYGGFDITVNGETKHVYGVGAGEWVWVEVGA